MVLPSVCLSPKWNKPVPAAVTDFIGSGPAWTANLLGFWMMAISAVNLEKPKSFKKIGAFASILAFALACSWFFLIPGDNPGAKPASDSALRSAMEQCPGLKAELAQRTYSISSWTLQDRLDECLAIARQKAVISNFK